jgi:hypothetical protein
MPADPPDGAESSKPESLGAKAGDLLSKGVEKRSARKTAKQEESREKAAQKRQREFEKSPLGRARAAFSKGDLVFQVGLPLESLDGAVLLAIRFANRYASDPSAILNGICREGWELVSSSVVFAQSKQQMQQVSTTSQVAVTGQTTGYYVFRRCEANRGTAGAETA